MTASNPIRNIEDRPSNPPQSVATSSLPQEFIQNLDDSEIHRIYEDLLTSSKFPLSFLTDQITVFQITGKHIRFVRHKVFKDMSVPKFAALLREETGLSDISPLMLSRYEAYGKSDAKKPRKPSKKVLEFMVAVIQNLQSKAAEVIPELVEKKKSRELLSKKTTTANEPKEKVIHKSKNHLETQEKEMISDTVDENTAQDAQETKDHLDSQTQETKMLMLQKLRKQLESLHEENLSKEWKSYLEEMLPQDRAISNAGEVLEELKHFDSLLDSSRLDCKVLPSANGGVGICFFNGSIYADIECFNTGEVLAVIDETSSQDNPEVWEITDLNQEKFRESLEKISARIV
jgi:hypothetical protein